MTDTVLDHIQRQNEELSSIASDIAQVAAWSGTLLEKYRSISALDQRLAKSGSPTIESLQKLERLSRAILSMIDRITQHPLPLYLQSIPAAGSA